MNTNLFSEILIVVCSVGFIGCSSPEAKTPYDMTPREMVAKASDAVEPLKPSEETTESAKEYARRAWQKVREGARTGVNRAAAYVEENTK